MLTKEIRRLVYSDMGRNSAKARMKKLGKEGVSARMREIALIRHAKKLSTDIQKRTVRNVL